MEIDKRYAGVGIAIILLIFIGSSGLLNVPIGEDVRDVNDYGTIAMISASGVVESLDTIQSSDGLVVIWTATISTSSVNTWLYTAAGINLEEGIHVQVGNVHTYTFSLDGTPAGTTEMYVAFGGMYSETESWVGSTPYFFVEQDSVPSFPAPEFTSFPDDKDVETGEQIHLSWWFIYTGPAIARITVDGVTVTSRATTQTTIAQPFSCDVAFSDAGIHKVKLIIEPEYDIPYANEVTITVTASTTTTTTTTSTTTEPPPADDLLITVMSGIAFVGVILVIIFIQLRERKD